MNTRRWSIFHGWQSRPSNCSSPAHSTSSKSPPPSATRWPATSWHSAKSACWPSKKIKDKHPPPSSHIRCPHFPSQRTLHKRQRRPHLPDPPDTAVVKKNHVGTAAFGRSAERSKAAPPRTHWNR